MTLTKAYGPEGIQSQINFYAEDSGSGVTSVNLMGLNSDLEIMMVQRTKLSDVAVKFRSFSPSGPWTLRLFKNNSEVATFSVETA